MITLTDDKVIIEIPCNGKEIRRDFDDGADKNILKEFFKDYFGKIVDTWIDNNMKET